MQSDQTFGRRAESPVPTSSSRCRSCGAALQGPFCHGCGQPARDSDSVLDLVRELFQRLTRYDRRVWATFPLLMFNPGRLSREWNEGRRAGRLSPLHLALFAAFVFCAAPIAAGFRNYDFDAEGPIGLADAVAKSLRAHALVFVIVMTPALTLILRVTCFKRGFRAYDHATVALHQVAFLLLFGTVELMMLALRVALGPVVSGPVADAPFALVGVLVIVLPIHLGAHLIGAYRYSWIGGALRTVVVALLGFIAYGLADMAAVPFVHEPAGRPPADSHFTRVPAAAPGEGA